MQYIRITSENIDSEHICCAMSGKQSVAKKAWLKERFAEGLVFTAAKNGASVSSNTSRLKTRGFPSTRRGIFTSTACGSPGP